MLRSEDIEDIGFLDWSLDRGYVLTQFISTDYVHIMALISIADGEMRIVKRSETDFCLGMSLSPDGRYLAYDWPSQEDSDRRDIHVVAMDPNDPSETVVTTHPANDVYPIWTPDGERILFGSDRTATFGVWMVEVLGGEAQGAPVMLQKDIGRATPIGLTRDGAYYYYRENRHRRRIYGRPRSWRPRDHNCARSRCHALHGQHPVGGLVSRWTLPRVHVGYLAERYAQGRRSIDGSQAHS